LQAGIPVVTGGGDARCGLLGADAVDSGEIGIVAGSTMPMQWVLDRGLIDDEARLIRLRLVPTLAKALCRILP
jgi:sugar (pentulose or hexulose) kinase